MTRVEEVKHVLLYGSNPRLDSGMGKTANEIAKGLARNGHEVDYFSPDSVMVQPETFPPGGDPDEQYRLHGTPSAGGPGVQMFNHKVSKLRPDVVLTNRNWQGVDWMHESLNALYQNQGVSTTMLFYGPPIETEHKPPMFEQTILEDHLCPAWMVPFTENRYVEMRDVWELENYLLPESYAAPWVPHGVDHDVFHPDATTAAADAEGLREGLGLGDRFVVAFVGENWRRKNVDLLLDAWGDFRDHCLEAHDERPFLLMHTDPQASRGDDQFYSGWNLVKTAFGYGLTVATSPAEVTDEADVVGTKTHAGDFQPREVVAGHLATADLVCLPTSGEGFSLVSLEAMACGTPLLQTDLPTLRWLCGEASAYIDTVQDHAINTGERMPTPSVASIREGLIDLYENPEFRHDMARAGLARAQDFSWERTGDELAAAVAFLDEEMV